MVFILLHSTLFAYDDEDGDNGLNEAFNEETVDDARSEDNLNLTKERKRNMDILDPEEAHCVSFSAKKIKVENIKPPPKISSLKRAFKRDVLKLKKDISSITVKPGEDSDYLVLVKDTLHDPTHKFASGFAQKYICYIVTEMFGKGSFRME